MNLKNHIEDILKDHLTKELPHHLFSETYLYALIPGGKYFRSTISYLVAKDILSLSYKKSSSFNYPIRTDLSWKHILEKKSDHAYLASFLEAHHTYTLIHDDLPCMDNDLIRRGRPTTHKKFGEWQALLAGDGLLNLSYQFLTKINHPNPKFQLQFIGFASRALGPKGLILGQAMDLNEEMNESFDALIRTHILKTARLIQVALLLGAAITLQSYTKDIFYLLFKLGHHLGVLFQLQDDFDDFKELELSAPLLEKRQLSHEEKINPFVTSYDLSMKTMKHSKKHLALLLEQLNFEHLSNYLLKRSHL